MTEDIKNAIEAGKISQSAGTALARLSPGTYVQHKSWGYGVIASHDFLLGNTIIDFRNKKAHPMKLEYAAESLVPITEQHIAARKYRDMDGVRKLAQTDPAAVVRIVLESLGGRASQEQLATQLVPDVFAEAAYKKWWEAAKKALKADPLVGVPQKKTEHFVLRLEALSQTDEMLAGFKNARTLKDQILALDNLTKALAAFTDASVLQPVIGAIEEAARKAVKLQTAEAIQLIVVRDEIAAKFPTLAIGADAPTVAGIFRDEETKLSTLLGELPVSKLKKAVLSLPDAFGEHWASKAVSIFMRGNSKVVPEAARLLVEKGKTEEFGAALDRAIRDQSITAEGVHWLCEERGGVFREVAATPRTLSAALGAMERDQFKEKRDRRLHDLLMNDKELVLDLIETAEHDELREAMRKLMMTPVFEELNKRSLLGRIVRVYPELEEIITGREEAPKTELIVSWESLERRKAELDDLVNKKIPQNRQDIQIARDYGDLRENFEYKSAKDQQRVLNRQKVELERDLARARGTDFRDVKTDAVEIGTRIVIKRVNDGGIENYTILGAWDTDPERHFISYLSQMAQALIGKKVGDRVSAPTETGENDVEVVSIEIAVR
jgi:transcription elongation GreA/GreB family factor/transcription elongation factor GreA-like protein